MGLDRLQIGYGGSLASFDGVRLKKKKSLLKEYFWTFKNDTVDSSTRSGYYLIKAVGILKDKYGVKPSQLKIHLWGSIDQINQSQIEDSGLSEFFNIQGYMKKSDSLAKLMEMDILFLPTETSTSEEFRSLFIPGKVFEYIGMKKPVLSPGEESDCREILSKSGLGILTKPDDPEEIAEKLNQYISDKSKLKELKPNLEYINSFNFSNITAELVNVFDELVKE